MPEAGPSLQSDPWPSYVAEFMSSDKGDEVK
jgi:hypothetical protein